MSSDPYLITNLADSLGYILQDIVGFIVNIFSGWVLMFIMITLGFIIIIYFRFFKKTVGIVGR